MNGNNLFLQCVKSTKHERRAFIFDIYMLFIYIYMYTYMYTYIHIYIYIYILL